MIYPFPNFNGVTVEVWEWISNSIEHFTGHVNTYPWATGGQDVVPASYISVNQT